uniref:Riboflavin transporter n=1 Tax=Xenopus tropicalis TaxID=8364 RepID=A0A803JIJ2_XENTR
MALVLHILACIFGTGAWVAINGLWVELPLIVNDLPEGWYLPSYLTIIIQLANIGPLVVTLMHKFKPGWLNEIATIYTIIVLGIVASFLLAFFWRETTWVGGELHSTGFLVLTFFLSLVDCTSSVTFLPFMMKLETQYLTSYFVGEGLSGFIPGLLSLIQGVGIVTCVNVTQSDNGTQTISRSSYGADQLETQYLPANYSVQVFLFLLCAMMAFCLVAFYSLTRISSKQLLLQSSTTLFHSSSTINSTNPPGTPPGTLELTESKQGDTSAPTMDNPLRTECNTQEISYGQYALIYFLTAWVNALTNGVLPSVQTYSCMPYGNLAYHLSAAVGSMANPLACLIAMFLPCQSLLALVLLSVIGTGFGTYNMVSAVQSPCPVLQGSDWGVALIVCKLTGTEPLLQMVQGKQYGSSLAQCYGGVRSVPLPVGLRGFGIGQGAGSLGLAERLIQ